MIPLTEADRAPLEAALRRRPELAMFPLGGLAAHGVEGTGHPHATRFWADDAAAPRQVLGLSEWGMATIYALDGVDAEAFAAILRDRPLRGISGQAAPVRAVMAAAGLTGAGGPLDADEPQFDLQLDALVLPDGPGILEDIAPHRETAMAWRMAYEGELHMGDPSPDGAAATVNRWIAADSHRMLVADGTPLALTGFNAALPDIVQIGGVYVPPARRGRRLAGRAVALHLAQARAAGVRRATLFAATAAAARSYVALGFRRIGDFALVLFPREGAA